MNLPMHMSGKRVLIAGAGGGYDVFAGLPLGLQLHDQGNVVFYANYSFTNLDRVVGGDWINPGCLKVSEHCHLSDGDYFPEKYLSMWLASKGFENEAVYCFPHHGVKGLTGQYEALAKKLRLDAIFVVDGGCDGIFRGDEWDLGTPSMDSISVISGSQLALDEKFYVLTAFGSEGVNHEVSHAEALNRISDLCRNKTFFGTCSLVPQDKVTEAFIDCMNFVYSRTPSIHQSNIINSMIASVRGVFGYASVTEKSSHSPIWISPLTSLFWFFDLEAVAKMKLFYEQSLTGNSVADISLQIEKVRGKRPTKRPEIPI